MLPPASTFPIPTTTTDVALVGGASVLTFYGFTETTGAAAAEVQLFDGSGTNGALIVDVALLQGESTRDLIPAPGLMVSVGLFLHVVSGSVQGSVWTVPGDLVDDWVITQGYRPVFGGQRTQ
jgi:hypothetical protein